MMENFMSKTNNLITCAMHIEAQTGKTVKSINISKNYYFSMKMEVDYISYVDLENDTIGGYPFKIVDSEVESFSISV